MSPGRVAGRMCSWALPLPHNGVEIQDPHTRTRKKQLENSDSASAAHASALDMGALTERTTHPTLSDPLATQAWVRGTTALSPPPNSPQSSVPTQAEASLDAEPSAQLANVDAIGGLRHSELWRLPYWDPTKTVTIEPMHCLLEGVLLPFHAYLLDALIAEDVPLADPGKDT
ncbi:hypothetical protein C8J57DRAFT_478821 [Mycena rebaudengoi]|nr:hypothetical protein C8J57DRAFT_478821 [Mycena rebaudengoi]